MNECIEQWRPVVGWEGLYEVSDMGRVRSNSTGTWRMLRPCPASTGYPHVILHRFGRKTGRTVHSMVADAFLGRRPDGSQVNHRNGVKGDARLINLEYATPRENMWHAVTSGLVPRRKLMPSDVLAIRRLREGGATQDALAKKFGVCQRSIHNLLKGVCHRHIA